MADTTLSPTGLVQIEVGASEDTWGEKLNDNAALLNTLLSGLATGVVAFTPVLTASGTPPTGVTYGTQIGRYARFGPLVVAQVRLVTTSVGAGGVGQVRITGLPIAASVQASAAIAISDGAIGLSTGEGIRARVPANGTYIELRRQISNGSNSFDWINMPASFEIEMTVVYFT